MTTQTQESETLQSWLPPDFDKQDLRNVMGLLLQRVKDLEKRLEDNKPFEEFNRYDQEISLLRRLANDANRELAKIPELENQVKVLLRQNESQRERVLLLEKNSRK